MKKSAASKVTGEIPKDGVLDRLLAIHESAVQAVVGIEEKARRDGMSDEDTSTLYGFIMSNAILALRNMGIRKEDIAQTVNHVLETGQPVAMVQKGSVVKVSGKGGHG